MGGSDGGGVSACRADGRQGGGQLQQLAGRPAIRQRRQPGGRRRYQTRRPAQEYHAAQAHRRSASHPPPERPALRQLHRPAGRRPQEIPNASAREDTTTRRPARNSKRARARYWRRGSRPLRVRKPKNFLGKGPKNRFRGAGAGKVGGVKNATEKENGAVLGKKEAAYAAACSENGGAVEAVGG